MLDRFYFNYAKNYSDMKILITKPILFPSSTEEIEVVNIEGRNGSLNIKKGTYKDKKLIILCKFKGNLEGELDNIEDWLSNIEDNRLIFNEKPNRAYIVKRIEKDDLEIVSKLYKEFKINFICEPFLSDLSETCHEITESGFSFDYVGTAKSDTFIRAYGNGNIQITIDDSTMLIKDVHGYVDIDSKLYQVRDNVGQSKDFDTTGYFIELEKGTHTVKFSSNVSKIEFKYTTKYK